MINKETIELLKDLQSNIKFSGNFLFENREEEISDAIGAVIKCAEKQEPKPAKRQAMHGYTTAHCSICGERVSWTHRYCPWCGQAVDLSKKGEKE
jgi:hypothetical protein